MGLRSCLGEDLPQRLVTAGEAIGDGAARPRLVLPTGGHVAQPRGGVVQGIERRAEFRDTFRVQRLQRGGHRRPAGGADPSGLTFRLDLFPQVMRGGKTVKIGEVLTAARRPGRRPAPQQAQQLMGLLHGQPRGVTDGYGQPSVLIGLLP